MNGFENFTLMEYEPLFILIITSIACALIGSFLVLRKLSMVADAISHSVLLGIVLAFFITNDSSSPYLIFGASLFGVITVFSIEMLSNTGLVKNDDAVGIVFPLFFSIAVILITKYARNMPFDTDTVLMGEVIMAPLKRITILGISIPKSLFQMGIILVINIVFIITFFKELKVTTFDQQFATIAGFSSTVLFYMLMTLSSFTTVIAFSAVGAILVISFLIAPGASAFLISKDLKAMLIVSSLYAVVNSVLGYLLAMKLNVSMSGMVAVVAGITFFMTFLFNRDGLITSEILRVKNKKLLKTQLFVMHIGNHLEEDNRLEHLGVDTIKDNLNWSQEEVDRQVTILKKRRMLEINEGLKTYSLTNRGVQEFEEIKKSYGM